MLKFLTSKKGVIEMGTYMYMYTLPYCPAPFAIAEYASSNIKDENSTGNSDCYRSTCNIGSPESLYGAFTIVLWL